MGDEDCLDCLEMPGQPYAFALWNLIIRPPRRRYDLLRLGPRNFRLWSCGVRRVDVDLVNSRDQKLRCSHFLPDQPGRQEAAPGPCVIYLHQNASCRLEALTLVPHFLPLGISLFCLDFAGCGESDGEYISLGWFERDDLAECVKYLRDSGTVSSIGLWGRSMGAVTALLHADRDHSIAGMVLDSPFCNLRQLATELAQSEYLSMKVPSWLLSGALAIGRLRIRLLCNFDIDELSPIEHVGDTFIPALFLHGRDDDFIAPHHSQKLFEAYTGEKELEIVDGDHNTPRELSVVRKAVSFLVDALRCDPSGEGEGQLAQLLGFNPVSLDAAGDRKVVRGPTLVEAVRTLAIAASGTGRRTLQLGVFLRAAVPFRVEVAIQLREEGAEAGYCFGLLPVPSDYGGANRPPTVLLLFASQTSLVVSRVQEGSEPRELARAAVRIQLGDPVLLVVDMKASPRLVPFAPPQLPTLRFAVPSDGAEISLTLDEEMRREMFFWQATRGSADLFDSDVKDLNRITTLSLSEQKTPEVEERPSAVPQVAQAPGVSSTSSGRGAHFTTDTEAEADLSEDDSRPVPVPVMSPRGDSSAGNEITSCCRQS
eukprot:TRINITY_DN17507_c0_g2_i1.p1 TRINITY_DN17507_c0_g2~~TRINITY_DN17507_c0_g2_i1.p1  ORF type:complete len:596 (+),score=96.03 TRINITY_DN17507_c0_g2_i1:98-1885(+)